MYINKMYIHLVVPKIAKAGSKFRKAIPLTEPLALTLRFLATGDSYSSLSVLFKVSEQVLSNIVPEVCAALTDSLKEFVKVARMIKFVDQEGDEKSMELVMRAEEEAQILHSNTLLKERQRVDQYYAKMEERKDRERIVQISMVVNEARIKVLQEKQMRLEAVLGEIYYRLVQDIADRNFYSKLFYKLILQALCMVLDKNVGIRILERDKNLIKGVIPHVVEEFERLSKIKVTFHVDARVFLPEDSLGGVVMFARRGNIKVENTLTSRLSQVKLAVQKYVRYTLFGTNPHRKHFT